MSSLSTAQSGASYEATVAHVRRVLNGFTPDYGGARLGQQAYEFRVPSSKLGVDVLAREVMLVFGAVDLGAEDWVAWCYGFTVHGVPCNLASTQSGVWLGLDTGVGDGGAAERLAQHVLDRLAAAERVVNKSLLLPQLSDQIRAGNVTITNQYAALHASYEYFREGAEQSYAGAGQRPATIVDAVAGRGAEEAWWNTLAMVSAYFSALEHVLIGCLPFTGFDPVTEDLTSLIQAKWNEKMKRVVSVNDPEAARQYAALRDIAERFRNTYSHGAFGRAGTASMSVYLPDVGEVPVSLGEFGVRPELLFVPAIKEDFDYICGVFDSCNDWLTNGLLADGYRWVLVGLDFPFKCEIPHRGGRRT
jgi:hypothetical protein